MQLKSIVVALALLASAGPAMANCYEDLGCDDGRNFTRAELAPLSCKVLWELRNAIFANNGYCFQTQRGVDAFGNKGCTVNDAAAIDLNAFERANVDTIRDLERSRACE